MIKFLLAAAVLLSASNCFAGSAVSISDWMASDTRYAYIQPSASASRISPTLLQGNQARTVFSSSANSLIKDSVLFGRPMAATSSVPTLSRVAGLVSGAGVVVRYGLAYVGPLAYTASIAMTAYQIYNLAKSNPTEYPNLLMAAGATTNMTINGVNYKVTGGYFGWSGEDMTPNLPCLEYDGEFIYKRMTLDGTHCGGPGAYVIYKFPVVQTDGVPTLETMKMAMASPSTEALYPQYQQEVDKAMISGLNNGQAVIEPSTSAMINDAQYQTSKQAASDAATTAAQSAQTATATAQTNYNNNPTPENKLKLDQAKAAEDALKAQQAKDALEEPDLESPTQGIPNVYDATITAPVKKDISSYLTSVVAAAPIVSMVRSFVIVADGSPVVSIGQVYGKEMEFDFTRYASTFSVCGGILLVIVHGFSILVVVRGW